MKTTLLLAVPLILAAQSPVFDVASLKPSAPVRGDTYNINLGTIRHGELTLTNATLTDCIKFANGLVSDDQVDGPDWIKSKKFRFDVVGKSAPDTPRDQLLLMLRSLLTERFRLSTHLEQRKSPHYALVVGKNGPKLHEVQPDPAASKMVYRIGSITHNQISMQTLALLLSRQLGQAVLDETALKGVYELKLEWTPENSTADSGPAIFTAVQEQLGLRLENRKDAMQVLVIDRADQTPVAN